MVKRDDAVDTAAFLEGGGELGALMRAYDWSTTPLGDRNTWPQSLRTAVSMLLPSKAQIILFWGPEFVVFYNDSYRSVFGGKHPKMLGQPGRVAWSEIWEIGANLHGLLAGVVRTGEAFSGKDLLFVLERHGFVEETYFDVSYDPVRIESGEVGGVYCIVSETTGRVVGERRLGLLRDLAARNATARTVREACVLAIETLATRPQDVPYAAAYLDGELQAGTPGPRPDLVEELSIGAGGALVVGLNPRCPFDEQYASFLALVADQLAIAITNAQAYEQEKARSRALAEIDRAKTAFFSNVSHEFRTPLTLMLGPLEDLLQRDEADDEARASLEVVYRNGRRLLKLVNVLLDFARIEAGRAQASYEPTDLGALSLDLASNFRSACERAGLRLAIDCTTKELAYVDREMWEKILLNLVSNAFKFTLDGEICVSLREAGQEFVLVVRDTGSGIPAAELPRVFERFHRVEGARGRSHEGSGIGLALVHELVKLHGGSIKAESTPGKGSTFTVCIPKGRAHLPQERIKDSGPGASAAAGAGAFVDEALSWLPGQESAAPSSFSGLRQRVLLADDNADLREYARRLLAEHYEVEAVPDGEAALAAARVRRPDLLISDVMMPKLDGFGLVRELRADETLRDLPVILLSARAGEEARLEGLGSGADDYLVKPFSARELLVRAGALLRSTGERKRAAEVLREEARTHEILNRVGRMLAGELDLEKTVQAVTDAATELSGAQFGAFFYNVHNKAGESYMLYTLSGARREDFERFGMPRNTAIFAPTFGGGGIVRLDDVTRDPRYGMNSPHRGMPKGHLPVKSYLAASVVSRSGEVIGGLFFGHPRPGVFGERAERLVAGIAAQAAVAIDNARLYAESQRLVSELREADRRKDEFMATLGHELRNPLAAIALGADLLRLSRLDDPKAQFAAPAIERQVKHLQRLADDMLDMARVTYGKFVLKIEPLDLLQSARAVAALHIAGTPSASIHVSGESAWAEADPARTQQMIGNLIENALKYGGRKIDVRVRRDAAWSYLSVTDDGQGIAPELLRNLFKPFVQGEQPLDRAQGGLGLGLSLVRRIAELHGGAVEARSDGPGRGSTFTISLPVGSPPSLDRESPAAVESYRRRVLLIDDEKDVRDLLQLVLESEGHEVSTAGSGAEGVARIEAFRPDIAVIDIGLPGMDGYEVARRVRSVPGGERIRLIAISGYGRDPDRERARNAGFDQHLTKPIGYEQLAKAFQA